jgi:uncharacterized Zn-binding protein involved in type VI secretion
MLNLILCTCRVDLIMPPAARITDMHTCPQVTGSVPHVGGPITTGSPDLMIGDSPAARAGDQAECIGPPDTVAQGSPTVFINGKPATRMGDLTQHGGIIITGCPTVIIGDVGMGGLGTSFAASQFLAGKIICAFT